MVFSAFTFVKIVANILVQELSDCTFIGGSILRTSISVVTQYKKLAVGFPLEICWLHIWKWLDLGWEKVLKKNPEGFQSLIFHELYKFPRAVLVF